MDGDQRLSASKIFAPAGRVIDQVILRVINAFRHQRFLHLAPSEADRTAVSL